MSPTSLATIASILATDPTLSLEERLALSTIVPTPQTPITVASADPPSLLLTQKAAAIRLGVDRTTVWRLVKMGILHPAEICPGTWMYQRAEIDLLARVGYRTLLRHRARVAA